VKKRGGQNSTTMVAGRSKFSDAFKEACDRFLKNRGISVPTFREMNDRSAKEGKREKERRRQRKFEEVAEEIERASKPEGGSQWDGR